MVRVIVFLLTLAALAAGAGWIADNPGEVSVTWMGFNLHTTNILVPIATVLVLAALAFILFEVLKWLVAAPLRTRRVLRERRHRRAEEAVSRGIVAIGAGDRRAAERHAYDAQRLAPNAPLTLLLTAQTAQLAGDRGAAETAFRAMLDQPATKVLGLRGLHVEAQRRQDAVAARAIAEEAVKAAPSAAWAADAVLQGQSLAGDWDGALASIERQASAKIIDKATAKRQRSVLMAAKALAAEMTDPASAKAFALEAHSLDPALVPAAAAAGRLLGADGEARKATKILEQTWKLSPHPDIAEAYVEARTGDTARDKLKRMETLAALAPEHPESGLSLARVALDASAFDVARKALERIAASHPTQRFCLLMAELAQRETQDQGRAREWMAKALRAPRDPAWTAEGQVSPVWLPVSPATGKLDAFSWSVPVAELGGPVLHVDDVLADAAEPVAPIIEAMPVVEASAESAKPTEVAPSASENVTELRPRRAKPVETVFPIERAPDDPGPKGPPEKKKFSFFGS